MTDRLTSLLRWWLLLGFLLGFGYAPNAFAQDQCERNGVVFGFFNGVQTLEDDAQRALHQHLEVMHGPTTPNKEPITYELFYNDTQGFADFVETFEQRLQEQNGLLAGRFELFFSATQGESSWWDALIKAIPALGDLLKSLFDTFLATLLRGLTSQLGSPNMVEVSARHQAQIDHRASLNQKMLFLAHSQGNLFVNKAYAHAVGKSGAEYVRVVHVAPASPGLSGRHTLADKDIVINGLRLTGTVAPNTDEIAPYSDRPPGLNGSRDLIGHGLLEIYLNPAVPTSGRIRNDVMTALRELDAAPRRPMPPYPDFISNPWLGGFRPLESYGPTNASHRVDSVIYETTVPQVFVKTTSGWLKQSVQYPRKYSETWRFLGPGMGGYQTCKWDDHPYPEHPGTLHQKECTYERMLWMDFSRVTSRHPDELYRFHDAPVGTQLSLTTLNFSFPDISFAFQTAVTFYSGHDGLWNEYERRYWQEPYQSYGPGPWLNESEILAWDAAHEAYRQEENRRYERYEAESNEYEEKRRRCILPSA
ncbi:hypothetical protein [Hydrogenophaga sp.]|uniref:hypothetical protein n=1 Tax=Hydrogenophaga sp. TaxID=1904254 RepID=UPI002730391E|nr:hypothetical protein [Hydrogenophaga sp.]MDP2015343.1 hypothetical protein [Hydrogenophaga sp.]MDP3168281.1 hypothetical protein [Hydrogenophaga sp.]